MATVYTEITEHNRFYKGEDQGDGIRRVGYYGGPWVTRYKFKAPTEGATKITIEKHSFLAEEGISSNQKIMFFISPIADSHINACYVEGASVNPQYDGIFTIKDDPDDKTIGYDMATGTVEKLLLPGKDYYLFFFPAFKTTGYYDIYGSNFITLTFEGSAGVIRIKEGDKELAIIPTVKENGTFLTLAATANDGGNFKYFA